MITTPSLNVKKLFDHFGGIAGLRASLDAEGFPTMDYEGFRKCRSRNSLSSDWLCTLFLLSRAIKRPMNIYKFIEKGSLHVRRRSKAASV